MTTIREGLLEELRKRDAHENAGPVNPPFIAAEDRGGEGYSRGSREVARFSAFSNTLVRESEPFQPDQASVKVPKLSWETRKGENHAETGNVVESGWYQTEYVVSGAVSLAPQRPSKFRGNPNLDCPSQKLAAFMQGEGDAWGWRDEDVRALFLAWANAVQPSATDARRASECLAIAMAARAGIAVMSTTHLPF